MELNIRIAVTGDLPEILSLYGQLGEDDGRVLSQEEALSIFIRMKTYPDYQLYLACRNERPVGCFALLIMDNLGHLGARSAIVEDLVVAEGCRGQGIGKVLMAHAFRLAKEKGCYKMMLSSNRNRLEAHRFYDGLGFERHGISFLLQFDE